MEMKLMLFVLRISFGRKAVKVPTNWVVLLSECGQSQFSRTRFIGTGDWIPNCGGPKRSASVTKINHLVGFNSQLRIEDRAIERTSTEQADLYEQKCCPKMPLMRFAYPGFIGYPCFPGFCQCPVGITLSVSD